MKKRCAVLPCLLALGISSAVSAVQAQEPFTLQDALDASKRTRLVLPHPASVLELDRLLPAHCIPPAAAEALRDDAARAARQQQAHRVMQHFLSALQHEDALLAARESVASTHGEWFNLSRQSSPEDLAQSATVARAFADYQHALAYRELTLAALRAELRQLAELTGHAEAPISLLEHPSPDAAPTAPTVSVSDKHPFLAAIGSLMQWWQRSQTNHPDQRSFCLETLDVVLTSTRSGLALQLDELNTRVDALRTRGLPAAEAELAAAEAVLDLARSTNQAATPMYDAMTGTVRAQGALRAVQHEILLLKMQIDYLQTTELD